MAGSLGQVSAQGAIPSYTDLLGVSKALAPAATSLVSAGTTDTLSAQQILSGLFVRSGVATAVAATTDTAANIVASMVNPYVGQTFALTYVNLNTGTGVVTVAAGAGVTATGTLTIPIAGARVFQGVVTSVSPAAVVLNSLYSLGSGVAA